MTPYYVDGAVVPRFADLMLRLAETLGAKVAENRIRAYAKLLGDVPWDRLCDAFGRAANERPSGFFPSIGEIRAYIAPTLDDAGLMAWAHLRQAVEDVGSYASIEIQDGAAAEALVVTFGSWPQFCAMDEGPALGARRPEFLAAYRQAVRHRAPAARLAGICQADGNLERDGHVWSAVLTLDGHVAHVRERGQVTDGDRYAQGTLAEGADAGTAQGQEGPCGTGADPGRPVAGGGA